MAHLTIDIDRYAHLAPIQRLAELGKELRTSLISGNIVRLDLSRLADPDIRIAQAVEAAFRHAADADVDFALAGPVDAGLLDTIGRAGLATNELSIWAQGTSA